MKTTMKKFAATTLAGLALAGAFAVSTGVQDVKADSLITLSAPKTSKSNLKKTADELQEKGFKYLTNYGYDLADYYGSLFGALVAEYDIYLGADGTKKISEEDFFKKLDENLKKHAKTKNEIRTDDDYKKVIASID